MNFCYNKKGGITMPATTTHAFFAEDLYQKLDQKTQQRIQSEKKSFLMFAQHTDPLMFYSIFMPLKGKKIRNLQHLAHSKKTEEFFTNLIEYIKKNKYYNNARILSFLYGFITHFCLDSNIHPYIYYKTGHFNKKDKSTYPYNCLHHYMETLIDNTLIKTRKTKHYTEFDISNYVFDLTPFSKELNECISYSFSKTYHINHLGTYYYQALKSMKLFLKLFRQDKKGLKRKLYKLMDQITPKGTFILDCLSYHQSINDPNNYLNINHQEWFYPVDKKKKSNKSFYDLYIDSLDDAKKIIHEIDDYFTKDKKINIHQLLKNKSLTTGIDCNSPLIPKYFEF